LRSTERTLSLNIQRRTRDRVDCGAKILPKYFAKPDDWRAWLEKHHASKRELWVGFYKKGTGRPSITWPESVDEALCFGWIDGVRKTIDAESYVIRFSPRRAGSIWSAVNTRRASELIREKRMHDSGIRAFEKRDPKKSGVYSFEQQRDAAKLSAAHEKEFKRNRAAWTFFQSQPPGYRKIAAWYVVSAKQEETRARRLATLIRDSAAGRRIGLLQRPGK
jgi:uncharacterized protein YdeI (YjbR/CyaY-like superfamily)